MSKKDRIYRRTAAGQKAWERQDAWVPAKYLRILGAIEAETDFYMFRARLPLYPDALIVEGLDELEERGFVEPLPDMSDTDLDFTGNFTVSELLGQQKAKDS